MFPTLTPESGGSRGSLGRALRLATLVAFAGLVLLSLLISLWPDRPAVPLITRTGWFIQGQAFKIDTPPPYEIRDSVRYSPATVLWRTWSPATLATVGTIRTASFKAPRYLLVPYGGFAGDPDISLDLVCAASGARLPLATARTNTQVTEAMVKVPHGWCSGGAYVEAASRSTAKFIEIGSPFRISRVEYYKASFVGLVGIFALVFAFTLGLLFLPTALALHRGRTMESFIPGFLCLGLTGYAMFFLFDFRHAIGLILTMAIFGLEIYLVSSLARHRCTELLHAWQRWKVPVAIWAIVAFASFSIALSTYNGAGPWTVNAHFSPVRWSTDNQLPMLISEYIFHGHDPRQLNFGPWKISDRPPLAYGLMAMLRLISWVLTSHRDGNSLYYAYQQISGIVINALWVFALYALLQALKLPRRGVIWVIAAVALTPFAIFNGAYIWPKMLGAAFGLLAFVAIMEPSRWAATERFERPGTAFIAAAALSALSILSHGGSAFGVIAAIIAAIAYRGWPDWKVTVTAGVVGVLVLVPWGLWQHFMQPPGNALVKYAFTGNFGFDTPQQSVFAAIRDAYAHLSWSAWISNKVHALLVQAFGHNSTCGWGEFLAANSLAGQLRTRDFLFLGPSLRVLTLGAIPLLLGTWTAAPSHRAAIKFSRILVYTGLISVGLYTLFGFHCYINHMQSYQAELEILAGLAVGLYCTKHWLGRVALLASMTYGIVVWIADPIFSLGSMSWPAVFSLGIVLLGTLRYLQKSSLKNPF
ncbi:MAG: hypothetical protein KGO02_11690 [Alphaproteobacteria bacterium]|nr:hypothetical protein [Alphaproteobacteria bacterium]